MSVCCEQWPSNPLLSLITDSSACAKEETLDQATLLWDRQLIAHLIGSHGNCKCTKVNPKHWMKWIPYWMTADYGSEKCTMRQLSTLFKMQSVHIVDYEEGHLLILHASLLIWAGNWKSQRRTRKQKKDKFKKQFLFSFSEYKPHTHILQTASFVFFWKKRQTTDLGTNQSLYNSQERSVMLTGKKKIMNFDSE